MNSMKIEYFKLYLNCINKLITNIWLHQRPYTPCKKSWIHPCYSILLGWPATWRFRCFPSSNSICQLRKSMHRNSSVVITLNVIVTADSHIVKLSTLYDGNWWSLFNTTESLFAGAVTLYAVYEFSEPAIASSTPRSGVNLQTGKIRFVSRSSYP